MTPHRADPSATVWTHAARAAAYYACMVEGELLHGEYLTLPQLAERMDWTIKTARTLHYRATRRRAEGTSRPGDLPKEDHRVGRIPLWLSTTIDLWEAERPGQGAGGGPKPRS